MDNQTELGKKLGLEHLGGGVYKNKSGNKFIYNDKAKRFASLSKDVKDIDPKDHVEKSSGGVRKDLNIISGDDFKDISQKVKAKFKNVEIKKTGSPHEFSVFSDDKQIGYIADMAFGFQFNPKEQENNVEKKEETKSENIVKTQIAVKDLKPGMTVEINGELKTIDSKSVTKGFMGHSLYGDASKKYVTRIQFAVPTASGTKLR